jgi:hypothetical protein
MIQEKLNEIGKNSKSKDCNENKECLSEVLFKSISIHLI